MEDTSRRPRSVTPQDEAQERSCDAASTAESIDLISVSACAAGWRVHGELFEDLMFRRGAAAERVARRLALAIAQAGTDARVRVYDAQHLLVGSFHYYAPPPWGSSEAVRASAPTLAGALL